MLWYISYNIFLLLASYVAKYKRAWISCTVLHLLCSKHCFVLLSYNHPDHVHACIESMFIVQQVSSLLVLCLRLHVVSSSMMLLRGSGVGWCGVCHVIGTADHVIASFSLLVTVMLSV